MKLDHEVREAMDAAHRYALLRGWRSIDAARVLLALMDTEAFREYMRTHKIDSESFRRNVDSIPHGGYPGTTGRKVATDQLPLTPSIQSAMRHATQLAMTRTVVTDVADCVVTVPCLVAGIACHGEPVIGALLSGVGLEYEQARRWCSEPSS